MRRKKKEVWLKGAKIRKRKKVLETEVKIEGKAGKEN